MHLCIPNYEKDEQLYLPLHIQDTIQQVLEGYLCKYWMRKVNFNQNESKECKNRGIHQTKGCNSE